MSIQKGSWADLACSEPNRPRPHHDQQSQTKRTCGLWRVADPTGRGGGLGPKTRLRWQLIPLLKSGKPPMDHLPLASSQHKDSGSRSSFTQEGVDRSDGVR